MKKTVLALGVAASLTAAQVVVPQSPVALAGAAESSESLESSGSSESESSASGSSDGDFLDSGSSVEDVDIDTLVATIVSILALVAAGAELAKRVGAVLPPLVLPPIPGLPERRGSCEPHEFDRLVSGWPTRFGTKVGYCDGKWAIAGADRTDWIVYFRFDGRQWTKLPYDGTKRTGMTQACFNGIKLRDQGAPEEFLRQVPICTPDEIGR